MKAADIYVTLGAPQLKEKPYRIQVKNFIKADGERQFFLWKLTNKPKRDVVWFYIVIGNKVRWKARFVCWTHGEIQFLDSRTMTAKNWAVLIDFEKLPKPYEHRKGFQGFRYREI